MNTEFNWKSTVGIKQDGTPWRVVLVDDEKIIRDIVTRILKSVGFNVVGMGKNGIEAIQLYEELKPDILILNDMMPKLRGLEALKQIRSMDVSATVLMIMSNTDEKSVTNVLDAGAVDVIHKPVDRYKLVEQVDRALE